MVPVRGRGGGNSASRRVRHRTANRCNPLSRRHGPRQTLVCQREADPMTTSPRQTEPDATRSGATAWGASFAGQVSAFLRTESASSGILVAAILAALVWANIGGTSYETVWEAPLSFDLNGLALSMSLREWVSSGLMTFFFLVVGLE